MYCCTGSGNGGGIHVPEGDRLISTGWQRSGEFWIDVCMSWPCDCVPVNMAAEWPENLRRLRFCTREAKWFSGEHQDLWWWTITMTWGNPPSEDTQLLSIYPTILGWVLCSANRPSDTYVWRFNYYTQFLFLLFFLGKKITEDVKTDVFWGYNKFVINSAFLKCL